MQICVVCVNIVVDSGTIQPSKFAKNGTFVRRIEKSTNRIFCARVRLDVINYNILKVLLGQLISIGFLKISIGRLRCKATYAKIPFKRCMNHENQFLIVGRVLLKSRTQFFYFNSYKSETILYVNTDFAFK